jgi:hypothetical protein
MTPAALVRLAAWARLERTPTGFLFADADEAPKVQAIAWAQRDGHVNPDIPPADVHSMPIALAMTWSPGSLTYTATAGGRPPIMSAGQPALPPRVRSLTSAGC